MNNSEFLLSLIDKGVEVWADGEQLRFRTPKGKLLLEEKSRLRQQRLEFIELLRQAETSVDEPIRPRPAGSLVPPTALQLQIINGRRLLVKQFDGARAFGTCIRILGPLNASALRKSFETVVQRHESLRSRIVTTEGGLRQCVDPLQDCHFSELNLSGGAATAVVDDAIRIAEETVNEFVEPDKGPLFEVKLLRLSATEHVLVMALDHLVTDRVSREIVLNETWATYHHAVSQQPYRLPALPIQFGDYAFWLHKTHPSWMKTHEQYWRDRLSNAVVVEIPKDNGLVEMERPVCVALDVALGRSVSIELRSIARRAGTSIGLVIFTIYTVALSRWFDQRDLVIAFIVHGRHRPELEGLVGLLSSQLHLRVEIHPADSFLDLLKRVSLEFGLASDHHDYDRVPEIFPGFDTDAHFNWFPTDLIPLQGKYPPNGIEIYPFPLRVTRPAKFAPVFLDTQGGINMVVRYRPDQIAASTISRFGDDFRAIAAAFCRSSSDRMAAALGTLQLI